MKKNNIIIYSPIQILKDLKNEVTKNEHRNKRQFKKSP